MKSTYCITEGFESALKICAGKVSSVRSELMGVAILFVILYHLYCWVPGTPLLRIFKWGFIGVDVFMFVSAFGLCFSYERNPLRVFYTNRAKRILPLLIVNSLMIAILKIHNGNDIWPAVKFFALNSTTLNYYLPGANHGAWFIPAIALLYLLFPALSKGIVISKGCGVLMASAICLLLSWKVSPIIGWEYDCLMARVPIFLLGILAFRLVQKKANITGAGILSWAGIWGISLSYSQSSFFVATMFCPVFMLLTSLIFESSMCSKFFRWAGCHSLELFFGHSLGRAMVHTSFGIDDKSGFGSLVIMVLAMIIGCIINLMASKLIYKYLK